MTMYVLDTQAFVWHLSGDSRLSRTAIDVINNPGDDNQLAIPTICLVEAWDLDRKKRQGFAPWNQIRQGLRSRKVLIRDLDLNVINLMPCLWTDAHDMIVLATALDLEARYGEATIVSSDRKMRFCQSLIPCIW